MRLEPIYPRHPWNNWADGHPHILTEGTDFVSTPESMQASVLRYAKRNDMYASATITHSTPTTLTLCFFDTLEEKRAYDTAKRNSHERWADGTFKKAYVPHPDTPRCTICNEPLTQIAVGKQSPTCWERVPGSIKDYQPKHEEA